MTDTATAPAFDFENAETWNVSTDTLLPVGNYICEIVAAEGGFTSKGNPQIELEVKADAGTRKDWLVYGSPTDTKGTGVQKVATLFKRAGVQLLNTDIEAIGGRPVVAAAKIAQLVGKKVGVVVRMEREGYNGNPPRPRIEGYVPVEEIASLGVGTGGGATVGTRADEDIPF